MSISAEPIRLGLIGCGGRLRGVVGRLLELDTAGRLRVTSAYDPDANALGILCQRLGYDPHVAQSQEEVINDPSIDWIFIGSWNSEHAQQAIAAMRAGKNVFCEKPLATTMEDCLAIQQAVRETGRVFAFGLILRYSPHYTKIREIIESGRLGRLVSFEFNETLTFNHGGYIFGDWRRLTRHSGGHILEKCCHDLDLANWFADSVPVSAASFGGRNFFIPENLHRVDEIGPSKEGWAAYSSWQSFAPPLVNPFTGGADIVDNQVVILEYANGVRASFHTNCNSAIRERRIYLVGTHGALRADLMANRIEVASIGWEETIEIVETDAQDSHGGGDRVMSHSLYETLCRGEAPRASVREGLCSAISAFGIDQAMRERRVVDLRPLWEKAGINPCAPLAPALTETLS